MRNIFKYLISITYKPLVIKYLSKVRKYSYKGICILIHPEVFHPHFFFSTKLLLKYISKQYLKQKIFLELGAGSGLISLYVSKQGASVTATDINPVAIEYLEKNSVRNHSQIQIIHSDLFDCVPPQLFDIVAINPPYYKKQPKTNADYAWYCGENGEYFIKLFNNLGNYMHSKSLVLMILSDGCDLSMIHNIANKNGFLLNWVYTKRNLIERNFIFKIEPIL